VGKKAKGVRRVKDGAAEARIIVAHATAGVLAQVAESVQKLADGNKYRHMLEGIVKTLKADQTIRHQDVDKLLEVLEIAKNDMSQELKDEYYRAILRLLQTPQLRERLPPPPA
jgi:hypothetical protein